MKREMLLTISVITLLLLNISMAAFLFLRPHPAPPMHLRTDRKIIETLEWNEEQQQQFEKMKHEHRAAMNKLDDEYEEKARAYFSLLSSVNIDTTQKQQLENEMAAIETKKAQITFHHFEDLKALCTDEQKAHFTKLVPQLIDILLAPNPNHLPPPRRD